MTARRSPGMSVLLDAEGELDGADVVGGVDGAHGERVAAGGQARGQLDAEVLGRIVEDAVLGRERLPVTAVDRIGELADGGEAVVRAPRRDRIGDLDVAELG